MRKEREGLVKSKCLKVSSCVDPRRNKTQQKSSRKQKIQILVTIAREQSQTNKRQHAASTYLIRKMVVSN